MHHTLTVAVAGVLLLAVGPSTPYAQNRDTKPEARVGRRIGSLAGVCVGVDRMRELASRLGCAGMPRNHGERTWMWRAARCRIRAVSSDGERCEAPLSAICMERVSADSGPDEPQAHGLVRTLGWLGSITPGVHRRVVEARSRSLGPPAESGPQEMIWRGTVGSTDSDRQPAHSDRCAAVLRFEGATLVSIRVVWR